jgi:hypothetical protein
VIEIIKGRIFWHEAYNNPPHLELLVSSIPTVEQHVYEQREDCYYSEIDGICSFFSWDGRQDRGYGGRHFTLRMKDGSIKTLMGPWSSSCAAMNSLGFGPCTEAAIITEPDGYAKGYTFYSGAVTMEALGRVRDRIAVTPYRISTEGNPWKGFDKMIVFPKGSRFTMLEVGSKDHKMRDHQVSGEQSMLLGTGGAQRFVPIVELPDGSHWVKPASHSVPIVPPEGAEVVDIPAAKGVWTGEY